jgi:hypothetical protein
LKQSSTYSWEKFTATKAPKVSAASGGQNLVLERVVIIVIVNSINPLHHFALLLLLLFWF